VTDDQRDTNFLRFWTRILELKRLRRQGWLDRGVDDPESTADHTWGVVLLTWLLARDQPGLDAERVILLALVHDLPEALAGDATPFDILRAPDGSIAPEELHALPSYTPEAQSSKQANEAAALEQLIADLAVTTAADIRALWHEYETGTTPEARFVRQIDKLETLLQAEDYLSRQPDLVIDSFRRGTRRDVTDSALAQLLKHFPEPPDLN
jgi:putative hydrolase of HD superfamily